MGSFNAKFNSLLDAKVKVSNLGRQLSQNCPQRCKNVTFLVKIRHCMTYIQKSVKVVFRPRVMLFIGQLEGTLESMYLRFGGLSAHTVEPGTKT